jgi:glycerol-3-phosphate dehydrogenase (NAD(P)+)
MPENENEINAISVIGNGSWATALIKILTEKKSVRIHWWMRDEESVDYIKEYHHNPKYLSSAQLPADQIFPSNDLQSVIDAGDWVLLAVPSAFLGSSLGSAVLPPHKKYITAIKGIEPTSKLVIAEYLQQIHNIPLNHICLISGPCHAEEVALEKLSYLTVSALNDALALELSEMLRCRYINVIQTPDLIGAEYASVLKNIYAIGSGIAHGLNYGDNFQAVFVSFAIREMKTFLSALHQETRDVKESAYLGDLLVTCYSQFSRNRTFGTMLGKGYSVKSAQLEMNMVAEGYYATELVFQKSQEIGLEMPIVQAVHEIAYEGKLPRKVFKRLAEEQLF